MLRLAYTVNLTKTKDFTYVKMQGKSLPIVSVLLWI